MTAHSPAVRPRPSPVGVPPSLRRWYDRAFTWDEAARLPAGGNARQSV